MRMPKDSEHQTSTIDPPTWKARLLAMVRLESTPLTVAFWSAATLLALAFLLCPYPPMIDYPQHVALGALMRQLMDASSPAHALYVTNLFTYNAGIESSIALLSLVVRPELAGRIILALHVLVFLAAALSLCDLTKRPRWYALLALPLVYNHITGWGFSNFVVALPVAVLGVTSWIRLVDRDRALWRIGLVILLSMVVAYSHVLVMLTICVVVAVVSLEVLLGRGDDSFVARVKRLLLPGLVLVPAVAYSLGAWFWARATSTTVWEHAWAEGQDDPLWSKLRHLLYNSTGNFADGSDQLMVALALALGLSLWLGRSDEEQPNARMRRLALVFFGLYAVVPKVFIATFHIYQRFLPIAALCAIAAIPVVRAPWTRWVATAASVLALVTAGNVLYRFMTIPELDDAMAIIDDAPAGHKLLGVTYDPTPSTFAREIWVHLPALYQVRKDGELAYSFLRNESVPVHYRAGKEPLRPPGGFEWNGNLVDVYDNDYARDYDLVLVRSWVTPGGRIANPAPYVFKGVERYAKLLSQRGRFFLYDSSEVNRQLEGGR